jgi:3-hydroxyisobutyrate dehydrogenase
VEDKLNSYPNLNQEFVVSPKNIGWIGTGVMGRSMCGHLLKAGYRLHLHTRSRPKAEDLLSAGAIWHSTPASVAEQSTIVFSIVGYPADVEAVYLGPDGVLTGTPGCSVIVDMTTSEPSLAGRLYQRAAAMGIKALDAPVSGGDVGAREGRLAIMVGGDEDAFQTVLPLFRLMGENIVLMGGPGAGQHTKVSNQVKIASTMIGVVESLLYGYRAGLDLNRLLDVIGKGAASSWSLNHLGRRIVVDDFDPGFFIKHFVKDMGIALAEARRMNLSLPGLALAHQFYVAAIGLGFENLGTQALYKVFTVLNPAVDPTRLAVPDGATQ